MRFWSACTPEDSLQVCTLLMSGIVHSLGQHSGHDKLKSTKLSSPLFMQHGNRKHSWHPSKKNKFECPFILEIFKEPSSHFPESFSFTYRQLRFENVSTTLSSLHACSASRKSSLYKKTCTNKNGRHHGIRLWEVKYQPRHRRGQLSSTKRLRFSNSTNLNSSRPIKSGKLL